MRCGFWKIAILLVAAFLFCQPIARAEEAGGEGSAMEGQPAPDFTVQDTKGNTYHLAELTKGKIVWLNFWGLRCGPCVRELPALEALYKQYADKGLLILGVNTDGIGGDFIEKSFAEREDLKNAKVSFPLIPDVEFKLIDMYQLMGAPLNVMIDHKGVIRYYHEGYEPGDEKHYEVTVKKLLGM